MDLRPRREYVLPDALRAELAEPLGPVVTTEGLAAAVKGANPLVAIGDVVSLTLLELGIAPRFFACDYRTQRGLPPAATTGPKPYVPPPAHHYRTMLMQWGTKELRAPNPAGLVTREAWDAVARAFTEPGPDPVRLVIEGEEDLLGLPAIVLAPDGAVVLYGSPGRGVVVVRVDQAARDKAASILMRMHMR